MMTTEQAEAALQAAPGDRVTKEAIEARIVSKEFLVLPGTTVTIASITLDNGYSVRGESACVDPRNFNKELGEHYAYEDAFRKLWPLFGFLLAEARFHYGDLNP